MIVRIKGNRNRRNLHPKKNSLHRLRRLIPEIQIYAEGILQTVHEALLILSPDLRVMWANESFYKTFQVGPGEIEGRLFFGLGNRQWDLPGLRTLLGEVLPKGLEFHDHEVERDFAGIGRRTMLLNAKKLPRESDNREMILLAIVDITERKQAEAEQFKVNIELKKANDALRTLVLIDDLTGLYNRRGFLTFAEQHMKLARRIKQELLLVYLDLDGLKQINDTFGHQEGDRALVNTAQSLKGIFHRDLDIIARLGGDEFVVLSIDSFHENAEIISAHLQENLDNTTAQINCGYRLSFCLGMTRFNIKGRMTINDLMAKADMALYKNKRARPNIANSSVMPVGPD
jgi:diguanylate cyclase (GGDEF)-like protein